MDIINLKNTGGRTERSGSVILKNQPKNSTFKLPLKNHYKNHIGF